MQFNISPQSERPVYLQLVDQVRIATSAGLAEAGTGLPSIRALAEELRLNRNTVAKAYSAMEKAGLVQITPRQGVVVKKLDSAAAVQARDEYIMRRIDEAIEAGRQGGIGQEAFMEMVRHRAAVLASTARPIGKMPSITPVERPVTLATPPSEWSPSTD